MDWKGTPVHHIVTSIDYNRSCTHVARVCCSYPQVVAFASESASRCKFHASFLVYVHVCIYSTYVNVRHTRIRLDEIWPEHIVLVILRILGIYLLSQCSIPPSTCSYPLAPSLTPLVPPNWLHAHPKCALRNASKPFLCVARFALYWRWTISCCV